MPLATTCQPATNYDTRLNVYCVGCGNLACVTGNDDQSGAYAAANSASGRYDPGSIYAGGSARTNSDASPRRLCPAARCYAAGSDAELCPARNHESSGYYGTADRIKSISDPDAYSRNGGAANGI